MKELRRPLGLSTPIANKVVVHLCGPQSPITTLREDRRRDDLSLWLFGKCEKDAHAAALRLFPSLQQASAAFRVHPDFERWRSIEEECDHETTQGAFLAARLSGLCAAEHSGAEIFESHDEAVELSTWADAHWPCVAGENAAV